MVNNIEKKERESKEIKEQYTNRKCGDLLFTPIESSRESSPRTFLKDVKIMLHNISCTLPYDLYYLPIIGFNRLSIVGCCLSSRAIFNLKIVQVRGGVSERVKSFSTPVVGIVHTSPYFWDAAATISYK